MPQIKCYKNCCAHNYCTHCTREGINVNDDALCSSYNERNETNAENARYEYEFAKDMREKSRNTIINLDYYNHYRDESTAQAMFDLIETAFRKEYGVCESL